jgi:hypothetical protein
MLLVPLPVLLLLLLLSVSNVHHRQEINTPFDGLENLRDKKDHQVSTEIRCRFFSTSLKSTGNESCSFFEQTS